MARLTVNISKVHNEKLVNECIDAKNYMQLGVGSCARKELFFFAAALGYAKGVPVPFNTARESFARTEGFDFSTPFLYGALFYDNKVRNKEAEIEEIVDEDKVYGLIEQYANKGFEIIQGELDHSTPDISFMNDLLGELDEMFKDIKAFVSSM